jgi:hypothetical protein
MYGVWVTAEKTWVGHYAPKHGANDPNEWFVDTYCTKSEAEQDIKTFAADAENYEVRKYDGSYHTSLVHLGNAMKKPGTPTMSTTYKVRARKIEAGIYELSYGRGQKKIIAKLMKDDKTGWSLDPAIDSENVFFSKKTAQESWGVWAEKEYTGETQRQRSVARSAPPPPPFKRTAPDLPPTFKRTDLAPPEHQPSKRWSTESDNDVDENNPYLADFLNPEFYERTGEHQHITELGALEEVFAWMQTNVPFDQHICYPWVNVRRALIRRFPNEKRYRE